MKVTITFEQNVLDGIEAAKLVLAVKRAIDGTHYTSGPICDTDGTVLGQWKAERPKRKAA